MAGRLGAVAAILVVAVLAIVVFRPENDSLRVAVEPAPLGTFVVARPATADGEPQRIPVFRQPFGRPRALVDKGHSDVAQTHVQLFDHTGAGAPIVLRVVAGDADDDWLKVQAPTRPHDRFVWVRRSDFDIGFTDRRIEIDLAGAGRLQVLEGEQVLLESGIVQARPTRETPTHVTYVEGGVARAQGSHAYDAHVLAVAGAAPRLFLHGTNRPELIGERITSGEIRLPNARVAELVELIEPGTPVLLYDSSDELAGREQILGRTSSVALTVPFEHETGDGDLDGTAEPQLWRRCPTAEPLFCRS